MAGRKLGAKLTAIRGHMARHIDDPFQKTRKLNEAHKIMYKRHG